MNTKGALSLLGWMVPLVAACEREPGLGPDQPTTSLKQQQVVIAQAPSYTALDAAAARGTQASLHLWVNTGGQVPRSADAFISSVPVFGYAWVDLATGLGVVAVIHPLIGRDSRQNPKGWHTHPVQLSAGAAFDFCIAGLGTAQGGIGIHDDVLRLNIALEQAGLSAGVLDVAAAFVVQPDAGCAVTGLGVDVLDAESLT
jgi:hypothetical protein